MPGWQLRHIGASRARHMPHGLPHACTGMTCDMSRHAPGCDTHMHYDPADMSCGCPEQPLCHPIGSRPYRCRFPVHVRSSCRHAACHVPGACRTHNSPLPIQHRVREGIDQASQCHYQTKDAGRQRPRHSVLTMGRRMNRGPHEYGPMGSSHRRRNAASLYIDNISEIVLDKNDAKLTP